MNKLINVVIVNGFPRAGKDTFIDAAVSHCKDTGIDVVKYSTIDSVKKIAKVCGWDGKKTPENRKKLSDLKDWTTKEFDLSFVEIKRLVRTAMAKRILGRQDQMIFIQIREPEEIKRVFDQYLNDDNVRVTCLVIYKTDDLGEQSNHADRNVNKIDYDYAIRNDGSIEVLTDNTMKFVNLLLYN